MEKILSPRIGDYVGDGDDASVILVNHPSMGSIYFDGKHISDDARVEAISDGASVDVLPLVRHIITSDRFDALNLTAGAASDAHDAYGRACAAFEADDLEQSTLAFLKLLIDAEHAESAVYGLAASLCKSGQYREAIELALVLIHSKRHGPRALILGGFAAHKIGDTNLARRCLARASRMMRGKPEFREEMRIAQRLLLAQVYGD